MTDYDIFAALAQVRKGAVALTCATRTLVRDRRVKPAGLLQ
jgi:hypothetical protein